MNCIDPRGTDAIYIADFNYNSGFPFFGHAVLLIQDENGNWFEIEYTGSIKDKKHASIYISKLGNVSFDEIIKNKRYENHIYIYGDFSGSYQYAKKCQEEDVYYGGYDFFSNNCQTFANDVLRHGVADDEKVNSFIQESTLISPVAFYKSLSSINSDLCNKGPETYNNAEEEINVKEIKKSPDGKTGRNHNINIKFACYIECK